MIRRSMAQAREELARTRIDRGEIERELREAMAEARIDREELQRDLAGARADIAEAMREIDAHSAEIRRAGQNPEQLKRTIRTSMKAIERVDVDRITRDALASIDPRQIEAAIAAAEAAMRASEAEMSKIEALEEDE